MECPLHTPETGGGGIIAKLLASGDRTDSTLENRRWRYHGFIWLVICRSPFEQISNSRNGHRITANDFPELHIASEGGEWGAENGDSRKAN